MRITSKEKRLANTDIEVPLHALVRFTFLTVQYEVGTLAVDR